MLWKPTSALFWVSDSVGLQPPTASDLRQQPPTASDLRQRRTSSPTASDFYLRQRRTQSISDSVGLLSPTASDFYLRQRRTSTSDSIGPTTASDFISDSVGLQSPTASDFNLQQLASLLAYQLIMFWERVAKGARMPDDLFQMLKVYMWTGARKHVRLDLEAAF